jgi:hypothetical protein
VRVRRGPLDTWTSLERPFHTPTISPGSPCPTSARDPKGDLTRIGYAGPAWGTGPAYPGFFRPLDGKPGFYYDDPIPPESVFYGSKWSGQKVLWVFDRQAYAGPILIRGRQLDGLEVLRFDLANAPVQKIFVRADQTDRPSMTRVRAPGCYAYQIDGASFSDVLVFEAKVA